MSYPQIRYIVDRWRRASTRWQRQRRGPARQVDVCAAWVFQSSHSSRDAFRSAWQAIEDRAVRGRWPGPATVMRARVALIDDHGRILRQRLIGEIGPAGVAYDHAAPEVV